MTTLGTLKLELRFTYTGRLKGTFRAKSKLLTVEKYIVIIISLIVSVTVLYCTVSGAVDFKLPYFLHKNPGLE